MSRSRSIIAALVITAGAACAARPAATHRVAAPPALKAADAMRRQGCLLCLRDAVSAYVAAGDHVPLAVTVRRFETELLLAVRSRELGLDAAPVLDRARSTGSRLPSSFPVDTYLEIADAVAPGPNAVSRAEDAEFRILRLRNGERIDSWLAFLDAAPAADDVNAYLALALACSRRSGDVEPIVRGALARQPAAPIVQYAAGACRADSAALLEQVLAREPRYGEAALHLGRYAMSRLGGLDPRRSQPWLEQAYAVLPDVPAVTYTVAGLHSLRRDWPNVLRFTAETVAIAPGHMDARLGQITALSHLGRHREAIAEATRVLDTTGVEHGTAYYWRGWNEYQLAQLDAARADADAALALAVNTDVETLAGVVALDQQRLDDARAHLGEARRLDETNCAAAWHLGRTESGRSDYASAADAFRAAVTCYDAAVDHLRSELEELRAADDRPAGLRDAQVTEAERNIEQTRVQGLAAAFNAGWSLVQAKQPADAVTFLRRALDHPELHDRAEHVLRDIERK